MRRLICTFVVRIWQKQVFSWWGSSLWQHYTDSYKPIAKSSTWFHSNLVLQGVVEDGSFLYTILLKFHKDDVVLMLISLRAKQTFLAANVEISTLNWLNNTLGLKKKIPMFPLTRLTLRFRADSAILIAILKK